MDEPKLKRRITHELGEFVRVFLFLAPLFCAFATYRMAILNQFRGIYFAYGAALVNALLLSKIILLGEYLKLGKRHECKPLLYSTFYKSFVFTVFVAVFHVLESAVKGLLHGDGMASAFAELKDLGAAEVLARSLVMFCALLPFFALRETARAVGERKLEDFFLRSRAPAGMGHVTAHDLDSNGKLVAPVVPGS
jgi:hypothetical protein